jgi:hypothetical protein
MEPVGVSGFGPLQLEMGVLTTFDSPILTINNVLYMNLAAAAFYFIRPNKLTNIYKNFSKAALKRLGVLVVFLIVLNKEFAFQSAHKQHQA